MYEETLTTIRCPKCGGTQWKKYGSISCSVAPFEAMCVECGYRPDVYTNRLVCPSHEFVFLNSDGYNVRHLECYVCKHEQQTFTMQGREDKLEKMVYWGFQGYKGGWVLPDPWFGYMLDTKDFDGNPIKRPIVFCSKRCKDEFSRRK